MKKLVPYILFAVALGVVAVIFYVDTLDMAKAAYQLPRLLIVLVMGLSVLMIVERVVLLRKPATAAPPPDNGDSEAAAAPAGERSLVRIAVFVALLIGYVMTIKPLGYFIATPLFLIAILSYLRATRLLPTVLIATGFTVFVYLLFVLFLNLPVPMGLLE